MTHSFKVGDRVRRTVGSWGEKAVGDEGIVHGVPNAQVITFENDCARYSAEFFELVLPSVAEVVQAATDTYIAKRDQGKPQFDLLTDGCPLAQLGLVLVLTWAVEVKGYKPHSWQTVPEAIRRYTAALHRHLNAKARGERYDPESGLLHDLHILACATFIAELEARIDKAEGLTLDFNTTFNHA